jgi:8-oxo-dGTP pyrophosphatase MutT (NUDIX family)
MQTLKIERNIPGVLSPNEIFLVLDHRMPPAHLITAVFGLLFFEDKLLMSRLVERGWDIPGGHVKPGETPQEALCRELFEETGASAEDLELLGYEKIVVHAPKPRRYRYPYPVSYQVFYCGRVAALRPFTRTGEAVERGLFSPDIAATLDWVAAHRSLYAAAYRRVLGGAQ